MTIWSSVKTQAQMTSSPELKFPKAFIIKTLLKLIKPQDSKKEINPRLLWEQRPKKKNSSRFSNNFRRAEELTWKGAPRFLKYRFGASLKRASQLGQYLAIQLLTIRRFTRKNMTTFAVLYRKIRTLILITCGAFFTKMYFFLENSLVFPTMNLSLQKLSIRKKLTMKTTN